MDIANLKIEMKPIGVLRTPYKSDFCPSMPVEREEGESKIILLPEYADGLKDLADFEYLYVLFYLHKRDGKVSNIVSPPWAKGMEVGLWASRSPDRPNPIGLSVVKIRKIENGEITTSIVDAWDETPVIDIKPYIKGVDSKDDANYGWIAKLDDAEHVVEHLRGLSHHHDDHHHEHDHSGDKDDKHEHRHGKKHR